MTKSSVHICMCACRPFGEPPAARKFMKDAVTQRTALKQVYSGAIHIHKRMLSHTYLFVCIHSPAFRRVAMTHLQFVVVYAVVAAAACGAHLQAFKLLRCYFSLILCIFISTLLQFSCHYLLLLCIYTYMRVCVFSVFALCFPHFICCLLTWDAALNNYHKWVWR